MQTSTLDHTLSALADPTRRAILQRLAQGEARVTVLAEPFAMSLNAVSKHILILERAQLVQRRKVGRDHFLSFNPQPLDAALQWIDTQRALWNSRLDTLEHLLREEDRSTVKRKPAPIETTSSKKTPIKTKSSKTASAKKRLSSSRPSNIKPSKKR